jgi:hypothetical protein
MNAFAKQTGASRIWNITVSSSNPEIENQKRY